MNLAAIELHLLHAGGFVPARDLCERFQLSDARQLRADKGLPGPLDDFAVSSTRDGQHGFTHQRHLSQEEWAAIEHRLHSHGVAELRKVRHWRQARHNVLTGKRPDLREVHGGQMLLLPV